MSPASPNTTAVVGPVVQQPMTQLATIQPTTSNFDEAIRIARAEMERDAYKQALQESQSSVDNTKWMITSVLAAIGLILTVITIILVLFGYVAYKETKRHEKAVAEAEQSAKDAKKWEQDAKIILANVDTQAKGTLDKIREEGKKQISEMMAKAETQRNISELWNNASRLHSEGRYAEACDKWRQIIGIKSDICFVDSNLCATFAAWAAHDKNDGLFNEARNIYDKLKALASSHNNEPVRRHCLAYAGYNLAKAYGEAGKMGDARSIYDEIQSLAAKFDGEPAIRENQAMAGVNLVSMYEETGNMDDAHNIYKELKSLAEKHENEPMIQECQAVAGISLITIYVKNKKMPEAKAMFNEVEPLVEKLPEGGKRQMCIASIQISRQKLGIQ